MFSTLRQTFGDGDRLLSVEIAPPFDKDRTSMRTACERCRAQKCVSGENGCMLCVAKNRKCEYLVISRPQRRTSSVASGGSKSRNGDDEDDDDDDSNNSTVANQHKQAQQVRRHKRRSRAQSMRQSSPLTTHLSSPKDHQRVITAPQPSPQDSTTNSITTGPDVGLEDAEQQFLSTLFPDSLGQMPSVFPHFSPDFFGNMAGLTPTATSESQAGQSGVGFTAEALTTRRDSSKQSNHTSVYSSSSADSLFEYGIDPMDFLLDESRVSTAVAPSGAHDTNRATTKARPAAAHSSTSPESVATSAASSSCCCMMTAVSIYETMQAQLVWGDPMAGPSTASTPSSTSAGSSYSSGLSWSGSESGSGIGTATTAYQSAFPLMTQQTILKRQKMILLRCDSLVNCGTCWSRPDFVMLIMTMCDRILTSLEAVERFVCSRNDEEMSKASSNGTATALDMQTMTTPSRAGLEVPSLSRSSQMLQPGVGAWQIDDDDEMELVVSLIKSRVTRLGNLITMAEGTISANAWPWHERLVQALRKRSNKLLISLSFRHFA
ncbi:transcription factor [Fusarium tjaetaba]|uniref:Transcription factor n=1 Tax=Fusarium tjaetaba TaxID=1567544 RepID=A0A8H5RQQ3_9HYPO|nr:transcription factor [Fusarium tjaetaba]KAF5636742.1 transcription factor [Fusarium tjaetaba]